MLLLFCGLYEIRTVYVCAELRILYRFQHRICFGLPPLQGEGRNRFLACLRQIQTIFNLNSTLSAVCK